MGQEQSSYPIVTISRRGGERIRAGHVWVYRSDVVETASAAPGSVVLVQEQANATSNRPADRGVRATQILSDKHVRPRRTVPARPARILGTALYSSASEIALRMISRGPVEGFHQLLRERIRAAIAYRQGFVRDTNAYRVIFSEGDFLPGLIVDRYNDILSLQVLTQAMDAASLRDIFLEELKLAFQPRAIVERVDARVRKLERLEERESGVIWGEFTVETTVPTQAEENGAPLIHTQLSTEFQMNGVRFRFDALGGQKTGAFLDQRENYAAAAQYARGETLDVFCYQGGFALHLAEQSGKVTGVDSSRPALEIAEKNAALNGREIEWIEANAFDLLRDYSDAGNKYDCIVLDPPPFAKSRQNLATALRGYKELNLRALKMLKPGGILVTCSCSYHVSAPDFMEIVAAAALDSHRIVRVLENRGQAKDHPSVLGISETAYLKCLILAVS
ncbi:MAG: SAM-dependent methyltransferase [Acidobacteria bacterium]|nr:MAG: SAM-dependent methyltransferase [Acidobacteriota bacterium]